MSGKESKVSLDKPNEIITAENCLKIGERMAISALRFRFKLGCEYSLQLYNSLVRDINYRNNPSHVISDGYDFAQETALFLCGFIGKRLNDQTAIDKDGKIVSIKLACIKMLTGKLHQKISRIKKAVCLDDIKKLETPVESTEITEEQDNAVNEKIERMRLTDKQKEVLLLRITGLTFSQIAKFLCKGKSVLFKHLHYVQKKYIATFNDLTLN